MARWSIAPIQSTDDLSTLRESINKKIEELNLIFSELENTDNTARTQQTGSSDVTAKQFRDLSRQVQSINITLRNNKIGIR